MIYYTRFAAGAFVLALLTGCASVSVKSVTRIAPEPSSKVPKKIYVQDFAASPGVFRASRTRGGEVSAEQAGQAILTRRLVERLQKYIAPAVAVGDKMPGNQPGAWLVTGRFLRVNRGSRALRALVGFGLGGSKMETRCEVFDLAGAAAGPFLVIETTGGSNAEPGAIFQGDPITGTATLVYASTSTGITADASRTARMITATISTYLAQRGAIPPTSALKPKPLGGLP